MSALLKLSDEGNPGVQVATALLSKADDLLMEVLVLPFSQSILQCLMKVDVEPEVHVTLSIGAEVEVAPDILHARRLQGGHQI